MNNLQVKAQALARRCQSAKPFECPYLDPRGRCVMIAITGDYCRQVTAQHWEKLLEDLEKYYEQHTD